MGRALPHFTKPSRSPSPSAHPHPRGRGGRRREPPGRGSIENRRSRVKSTPALTATQKWLESSQHLCARVRSKKGMPVGQGGGTGGLAVNNRESDRICEGPAPRQSWEKDSCPLAAQLAFVLRGGRVGSTRYVKGLLEGMATGSGITVGSGRILCLRISAQRRSSA